MAFDEANIESLMAGIKFTAEDLRSQLDQKRQLIKLKEKEAVDQANKLKEKQRSIEAVGEQFVQAKEALDVLNDFQQMLASDLQD